MKSVTRFRTSTNRILRRTSQTAIRSLQKMQTRHPGAQSRSSAYAPDAPPEPQASPGTPSPPTTSSCGKTPSLHLTQSLSNRLHLPERLIPASRTDSATLYLALQKHLALNCHNSPRQPGCVPLSRSFRCRARRENTALLPISIDRMRRSLRRPSIRSLLEQQAIQAVFGIVRSLMFHIRNRPNLAVTSQQLHFAKAVLTTKLCIAVRQRLGDALYLPERLVPAAILHTAPFLHIHRSSRVRQPGLSCWPQPSYGQALLSAFRHLLARSVPPCHTSQFLHPTPDRSPPSTHTSTPPAHSRWHRRPLPAISLPSSIR